MGSLPSQQPASSARFMRTMIEEASPHSSILSVERDRGLVTVLAGERAGALHRVTGTELIIGRGEDAHMRLFDEGLSRNHARIFRRGPLYMLEDMGSTNGTYLGTQRLERPALLQDEARIGLGRRTVLKFSLKDALEESVLIRQYESTVRDPLTGAFNRRALDERLAGEFAFAHRHRSELCVFMVDVDHFKRVNDSYGHAAGDEVLRVTSQRIMTAIRTEDFFARFGGEEFCLLARGISIDQAMAFGERLRGLLQQHPIRFEDQTIWITASFGVSWMDRDRRCPDGAALVAGADAALYEAKRGGRNRVVRAP